MILGTETKPAQHRRNKSYVQNERSFIHVGEMSPQEIIDAHRQRYAESEAKR